MTIHAISTSLFCIQSPPVSAPSFLIRAALLIVCCLMAGCRCDEPSPTAAKASASGAVAKLEPLTAASALQRVLAPTSEEAWAWLPLGATSPQPITILMNGRITDTKLICQRLVSASKLRGFALCLSATQEDSKLQASSLGVSANVQALRAALQALKSQYPGHVAAGAVTLIDYGPTLAHSATLLRQDPAFFSRALLITDDASSLSPTLAALFPERGGKRWAVVCATTNCETEAYKYTRIVERGGALTRVVTAELDGIDNFERVIRGHFRWVVDGDDRFLGADAP